MRIPFASVGANQLTSAVFAPETSTVTFCGWEGAEKYLVLVFHASHAVTYTHRIIILSRGSMFAFQWREFSPPSSSAHRLFKCYHSQWEIGDAAIPGELPLSPRHYSSQSTRSLEWRHAVTLHILVRKICISFFLFYCEGMLSLVVLWLCAYTILMAQICTNGLFQDAFCRQDMRLHRCIWVWNQHMIDAWHVNSSLKIWTVDKHCVRFCVPVSWCFSY